MIKKLILDNFKISLKNIPRTFSPADPISDIIEYFQKNPDISTAVILDAGKRVQGVVTRNGLMDHLKEDLNHGLAAENFLSDSYQTLLLEQADFAILSDYVKNNFEDLIILDGQGHYRGLATPLELANRLLKEREDQDKMHQALLDSTGNGILVVDNQAKVVFINQPAERMLSKKLSQAAGESVEDIIAHSPLAQVLKTGRPEIATQHENGDFTFIANHTPIKFEGNLVGAMAQFVDMGSENFMEKISDLKNFINILEMVMDNANVGLIFCDANGIIRVMNRLYEDLLGINREEAYGKHITEYFPDSRLPIVLKTGKAELGWKYRFQDKTTLVVNRILIKRDNKLLGAITQCIFKDISEMKEMARKLDLLENKVRDYESELKNLMAARYGFKDILARSKTMAEVKRLAKLYAITDAPVLITGETGTGKELFAHAIHAASKRREGPFVCVNCAAIPNELVEAELFGYAPGAFTGANRRGKIGKMELAHGGTLLLDEIGDLPLQMQAKLLRVIEQKVLDRVGAIHPIEVDFRLLAATNKDLLAMIKEGTFREDLYYRLGTMLLRVPSLRERKEDIPLLAEHCLRKKNQREISISEQAMAWLMNYTWKGNVRELKSILDRALSLIEEGDTIQVEHLGTHLHRKEASGPSQAADTSLKLKDNVREEERSTILKALQLCKGNKSKTAQLLGISRSLLYNKLKRYEINHTINLSTVE